MDLQKEWRIRGAFRAKSAAERCLELLLAKPILTGTTVQKDLKITPKAAYNALDQLVAAKIIRERTGFGRNRVFAAEEIIQLLARPIDEPVESALFKAKMLMKNGS